MIYLMNFQMPTREDEENYFSDKDNIKVKKTCYTTYYPFQLFQYRELPEFFFRTSQYSVAITGAVRAVS